MMKSRDASALLKPVALATLLMCFFAPAASGACLQYDRDYAFDGMLTVEGITPFEGEGPVPYPVLELKAPLCMQADTIALENGALSDISKVQVILPREQAADSQPLIGQKVTVRGVLLAAISRHHVLPLVVDARSIEPISTAAVGFPTFWDAFYNAALEGQCDRLVDLAALPLETYGSLDSDPIELLDATDLIANCPRILQDDDALIRDVGAYPLADWRTAAPFDDQARLGDFEFQYQGMEWRWTGYYGKPDRL
ncbi:DUF4431 domain-containing protein [Aquamicrobium lusatiense]|uniref:DUF4431 domain-containing protein n=1 Tax=Aquamicrobium lusatiense TaxID=89772 RepID=UPI002457B1CC|nr:DUF4431 domain-containing protein [Aquamicrobium lusatiense]MDH4992356.1 DUF4431 domain-containing protein [Aquamicrobium lusatiense]